MNILQIYRGYGEDNLNPVIDNQVRSIIRIPDANIINFIFPRGGVHYFTHLPALRRVMRTNKIDIVHAHYSFCGIVAKIAALEYPVIVSLMGSDVHGSWVYGVILRFFSKYLWKSTIVKSKQMKAKIPNSILIPNGIDLSHYRPRDFQKSMETTGFTSDVYNIIFVAVNPESSVKNKKLALDAIMNVGSSLKKKIQLHFIANIGYKQMPYYFTAADVLILTSLSEGSPNVIKEAMACNCPIVSTDVGDVADNISGVEGCYVSSFDANEFAGCIHKAVKHAGSALGRESIKHLSSNSVAKQIFRLYKGIHK
jgi:teichuronic acid biosynthesis glycosyltransferase TuaC